MKLLEADEIEETTMLFDFSYFGKFVAKEDKKK